MGNLKNDIEYIRRSSKSSNLSKEKIKFRGIRIDNQQMVYGYCYEGKMSDKADSLADARIVRVIIIDGIFYYIDPNTLEQYVETLNGVDIYEFVE